MAIRVAAGAFRAGIRGLALLALAALQASPAGAQPLRGSFATDGGSSPTIPRIDDETGAIDRRMWTPPRNQGVFNTVLIPAAHLTISARWQAILDDNPARVFLDGCDKAPLTCQAPVVKAFARLDAENEETALPRLVLIRKANLAVNHAIRYQLDPVTYGREDYWATPVETAQHGAGDCEDFAIMKMGMLAAFGLPLSSMQVVVLKDTKRNIGHAVLNVRVGEMNYILDNLTDQVRSDDQIANYQPFYSVSSAGSWLHGVRRAVPMASLAEPGQIPLMSSDPVAQLRGTKGRALAPAAR
jgi:predicted transglutaminase-like cysteine proteinase